MRRTETRAQHLAAVGLALASAVAFAQAESPTSTSASPPTAPADPVTVNPATDTTKPPTKRAPAKKKATPKKPATTRPQTYDPEAAEMPASSAVYATKPREDLLDPTEGRVVAPSESVDANDLLDEVLDEFAADVARLGSAQVSPLLLERIRVSDNVRPEFAQILEARLSASLLRAASISVVKCFECFSTRGRIEDAQWIVSRGITRKEDLAATAEKYGAKMLLDAQFTVYTNPSSLALDVQLIRASDGAIAFAEAYRVHPHTALLYRTADRAQKREARLKDLEARLDARPQFAQGFYGGGMLLTTFDAPEGPVFGAFAGYRLFEKFGVEREFRVGLLGGFYTNPRRVPAIFWAGATLQKRMTDDNVFNPACHAGVQGGYVIAPTPDEIVGSPYAGVAGECVLVHFIAVQASLDFVWPFKLGTNGYTYGYLVPQVGAEVSW